LTLQTEENVNVKIYLPKRYADVIEDDHIEEINNGKNINYYIWERQDLLTLLT